MYNVIKLANNEIRQKESDLNKLNDYFKTLNDMFYVLGLDIPYVKMDENDKNTYKNYLISKENKDFEESDRLRKILMDRE